MARILILEDNIQTAKSWRAALHGANHKVTLSYTSSEAIAHAGYEAFDVFVVDLRISINLSGVRDSGVKLLGHLNRELPEGDLHGVENVLLCDLRSASLGMIVSPAKIREQVNPPALIGFGLHRLVPLFDIPAPSMKRDEQRAVRSPSLIPIGQNHVTRLPRTIDAAANLQLAAIGAVCIVRKRSRKEEQGNSEPNANVRERPGQRDQNSCHSM